MKVVEIAAEARQLSTGSVGLVPTMGYLHEGHLSLIEKALRRSETVMMSLFVNPLQFDRQSDLDRYPRDLDRDVALAAAAGVDVLFAPPQQEMFTRPPITSVEVTEVTEEMEGVHRPGHFVGVATVVAKLFAALQPDLAFFGRKDHQQLALVRALALDLSFPVEIVGCPIIREPDGLALSSRNIFIQERDKALTLSAGLMDAADAVEGGESSAAKLVEIVRHRLNVDYVDYVSVASQALAQPLETVDQPCFLAIAAHVGNVRLIDNLPIDPMGEMFEPDRGIRMTEPSGLARQQ